MKVDQFTIALLLLRPAAPKLSEEEENALQDAHIAFLAKLHEEGRPSSGPSIEHIDGSSGCGTGSQGAGPCCPRRTLLDQDHSLDRTQRSHDVHPHSLPSLNG